MAGMIYTGHSRAKQTDRTPRHSGMSNEQFLEGLREKFLDGRSCLLWVVPGAQRGPPGGNWSPGQIQELLKMTVRTEQGENPWFPLGEHGESSLQLH